MNSPGLQDNHLLNVRSLAIKIAHRKKEFTAVHGVSFSVKKGESLCLVGESGCGKSLTALAIMGLLPDPPIKISRGKILFKEQNLLNLSQEEMRHVRGSQIGMVFQEPMTSLNPVFTVGYQIEEALAAHISMSKRERKKAVLDIMAQVGLPRPSDLYNSYPHELSGGLRQRVMIAMALVCGPSLLIADEPTTALDVTIQAQILNLLQTLQEQKGLGLLLITHNLGVVAQIAHRVLIMYAGRIVEDAPVNELFEQPLHPYTIGLMESVPYGADRRKKRLNSIPGNVPALDAVPPGCAFQDRCPKVMEICKKVVPELKKVRNGRLAACHLYTASE